jgi:hypothetical protein
MRRIIRFSIIFLVAVSIIPSCELLEDCKTCTLVIETSSGKENSTSATYCGAELAIKESEEVNTGEGTPDWKRSYYDCQ